MYVFYCILNLIKTEDKAMNSVSALNFTMLFTFKK